MTTLVAGYLGVLAFASVVFLGAGRLCYWQGIIKLPKTPAPEKVVHNVKIQ